MQSHKGVQVVCDIYHYKTAYDCQGTKQEARHGLERSRAKKSAGEGPADRGLERLGKRRVRVYSLFADNGNPLLFKSMHLSSE